MTTKPSSREEKKIVRVVAAVIKKTGEQGENLFFATQRGYGEFKDGWEFPGGKIEEGESPEEAIQREIMEELDTIVEVEKKLTTVEYDYPMFHLSMDCFLCKIIRGGLVLKEHEAATWLRVDELDTVDWLPADIVVVQAIQHTFQS